MNSVLGYITMFALAAALPGTPSFVMSAFSATPSRPATANTPLSQPQYTELRDLVLEIFKQYPPSEYHYVGLGRSPTGIISMIQQLDPAAASNLPFSFKGFKYISPDDPLLHEHFKRFLPSASKLGTKKILVIDYVYRGNNLTVAWETLRGYFRKTGRAADGVSVLGLYDDTLNMRASPESPISILIRNGKAGVHIAPLEAKYPEVRKLLQYSHFDDFAQYDSFILDIMASQTNSLNSHELQPRPEYNRLGDFLRKKLRNDKTARAVLKTLFPDTKFYNKQCNEHVAEILVKP